MKQKKLVPGYLYNKKGKSELITDEATYTQMLGDGWCENIWEVDKPKPPLPTSQPETEDKTALAKSTETEPPKRGPGRPPKKDK